MKKNIIPVLFLLNTFLLCNSLFAQTVVTGVVTSSEDQQPLIGVTVAVKGKMQGTKTDAEGRFTLKASSMDILVFTYVSFVLKEVKVGNSTNFDVILDPDISNLNEVVVVGYGTQKKSSLTGAVTSISTEQARKQIGATVGSTLQGLAPGVEILQPGGIAGANVNILIRGAATFGSTEPLYVIDGAFSNSSLNALNPNDIESIEILKDGSAAAIYGSRAANGVVLITTKKGKKGDPIIDLNTVYAQQTPAKKLNYLNASQYREFINTVADNSGINHAPQNNNPSDVNVDTDWQDAWLQKAPLYNVNLAVSGGNDFTTYNTSVGYLDQKGLTAYSGFKRYDFRVNSSYKKNRLRISESFSLSRQETEPTANISLGIPTVPLFDGYGRYTSGTTDYYLQNSTISNPLASLYYNDRKEKSLLLIGSLNVSYKILEGLEYKITAGTSYNGINNFTHQPVYYTLYNSTGVGISNYGNNINSISETRGDQLNYNIDNLLSYNQTFGKHNFDVLLGTSWVRDYLRTNSIASINDLGETNITGTGGNITGQINAIEQQSALLSYFTRINYDFEDRFLFSASIRNDNSSKFSKSHRSGWFPSISAGWDLSKEQWLKFEAISQFKIRASYGELGANFIDPYQFNSSLLGPVPSPFGITPLTFISAYSAQLFPLDIRWETSISKNIGADLGLFNNKLTVTIDYFDRTNKDLLATVAPPPSSGQALTQTAESAKLVPVNTASVQNKGLEFSLGYNKREGDFKWNIMSNFSVLRNEVLKLGDNIPPIVGPVMSGNIGDNITITQPGSPIGSFYGYEAVGLTETGSIKIKGLDADGNFIFKSIEEGGPADKVIIGSPIPDFTYALNFFSEYKKFDFTLFFQGVKGGDIFNWQKLNTYFGYNQGLVTDVLNSWTPNNTNTNIPKASTALATQSGKPSTFFIEDGSYLRLKNLQIGYNVETNRFLNNSLKKLRVYAGVQNLLTITNYSGYDPEVGGTADSKRTANMTTITRNADLSAYPNSRTFTIGLNASF